MGAVNTFDTWHESPNVKGSDVVLYILRFPGEKKRRRPHDGVMWYKERVYSCPRHLSEPVCKLSASKDLLALDDLLLQGKPFMEALELCPDIQQ
jgi:hypothetical protein